MGGILGCGDVCERKSGPAADVSPSRSNFKLVAVMRRDGGEGRRFCIAGTAVAWLLHTDAASLIADPEVDIVSLPPHPARLAQGAWRSGAGGRKPVYVEKPMAMNHAECLDMLVAAERCGQRPSWPITGSRYPISKRSGSLLEEGEDRNPCSRSRSAICVRQAPKTAIRSTCRGRLRREVGGDGYFLYDMAPPHARTSLDFSLGGDCGSRGDEAQSRRTVRGG